MGTPGLIVGIALNAVVHICGVSLTFLVKKKISKWAASKTDYTITSIIQIIECYGLAVLGGFGGAIIGWSTGSSAISWGFIAAFAAFADGVINAVFIAVIYERTTGISIWTGKPTGRVVQLRADEDGQPEEEGPEPPQPMPEPGKEWPWFKRGMRHWTWRSAACLLAASILAVMAWLSSTPLLYFPAYLMVTALVLEYILAYLSFRGLRRLEVGRAVPAFAQEDDILEVKLVVRNPGRALHQFAMVDYFFAEESAYEERKVMVKTLEKNATETFTYEAQCYNRGVFEVGPIELRREFPLRLFRNRMTRELRSGIRVHPHLYPAPIWRLAMGVEQEQAGLGSIDKKGWSNEFLGIREYQPGDPRRLIHWRSSAKCGVLMVRELEMAADLDLTAVIDEDSAAVSGRAKENTFEYMVKIVGSICREQLADLRSLRLITLGGGYRELVLGRGLDQLPLALDFLTEVQPHGHIPLPQSLDFLEQQLNGATTLILPVQNPSPRLVDLLLRLRERGIESRVILFDRASFLCDDPTRSYVRGEREDYLSTLDALQGSNFHVVSVDRTKGPARTVFFGEWG